MSFKQQLLDAWARFKAEPEGHPDTLRGLNVNPPPTPPRPEVYKDGAWHPHGQVPSTSIHMVRRLVWVSIKRSRYEGISKGYFAWRMVDALDPTYCMIMRNEKWRKEIGAEVNDIVTVTKILGPNGVDVRHVEIERAVRKADTPVREVVDGVELWSLAERNVTISTSGVAVDQDYYWNDDMTKCPRGVKVQLLGDGVASYGIYKGEPFWTHWAPLPKKRPA